MNKEQLQDIFRQPYNAQTWQELLINLFGASEIRQTPSTLTSDSNEKVEGFQLGSLTTTNRYEIGLFAFEIKGGMNLKLNRVGLRSLVKSYTRLQVDAAIVVFYDATHWRLSFICDIKDQKSAPKRYTYVFGNPQESYRTASAMLAKLSNGSKPTFEDIKAAFSVEALSKDFFKGYKEQYAKFCKHIVGTEKWQRDYVKKMMGRLVFLQFLQKKGWMGVPANQNDWEGGDLQYTQNLIKRYESNEKLLSEILEPLFFDTLNTKRENDIADPKLGDNIKIPYLNGGLFDQDKLDAKQIDFPYVYFAELMDFFSQYNFTIDENDPHDAEVGIDPEMLGHIFENLLEDNKDKGAFYTPKEIVQYMCRQSLIEYLQSKLGKHEVIEKLVNTHDAGGYDDKQNFIAKNAIEIGRLLDEVKICDPAIGSGAFPMGMLNEIFHCKMALNMEQNRASVKKNIIQNSIYGVDIEQGAVDIARLRFWLSLVVDESEPQPLPNLDYKIMQGNSLLESFEGVDLSFYQEKGSVTQGAFDFDGASETRDELKKLIKEYFAVTDHTRKDELRLQIDDKVKEHIIKSCGNNPDVIAKVDAIESTNRPFFLWHVYFADVFEQGGFDIVIGNPPYIQLQANGGFLADQLKEAKFKTFARTGDIYCVFYERGMQILRDGGIETYITSNKWMRAGYGEKLREYLTGNNPLQLLDLGAGVFESATVDTNILIIQKSNNRNQLQGATYSDRDFANITLAPMAVSGGDIWTILSPIEQSIKSKIETIGTPLRDWDIEIYRGVLTGFNEAFIINTAKRDELVAADPRSAEIIKPILRGRDIKRYTAQWAGLWLIATFPSLKIDIEYYPAVKNYLETFGKRIHQTGGEGCRKKTGNKWFETQDQIGYYEEFEKEKIIYPNMTKFLPFIYDCDNFHTNQKCFVITGDSLKYLLGFLNSSVSHYWIRNNCPELQGGTRELSSIFFAYIPIAKVSKEAQQPFIKIVDKILEAKKADSKADTTELEREIDQMVYALYNLTPAEILTIDPQTPITQKCYENHR